MERIINSAGATALLKHVAVAVIDKVDVLTDADLAIGDGDHGVGMRRGFEAALQSFDNKPPTTVEASFMQVGTAIMSKTGGAAGAVFGTLFRAGAKAFTGAEEIDAGNFSQFLTLAQDAVATRGSVVEGQKTMLDALGPAARAANAASDGTLIEAADAAARGALDGVEDTKNLIATTGKARSLGERSIGHPDPGAITVSIILCAIRDELKQL